MEKTNEKGTFVIPLLKADDIEVKVKQITEKGALALLYKTARTDMEYLDRIFGMYNWQCDYTEIKGNLYCTISIWDDEKKQWIRKQDCGIESREDGEGNEKKGEASDAFKRASTKCAGIGRELYTSPFIWLKVETKKDDKNKWQLADRFAKFVVSDIGYDDNRHINRLVIVNEKTGDVVYTYGAKANAQQKPTNSAKPNAQPKANEASAPKEPLSSRVQKAVEAVEPEEFRKPTADTQPKVAVSRTNAVPTNSMLPHERIFDDFLRRHNLERKSFIAMRAQAVKDGKGVTEKLFNELTPDEWVALIASMESLYETGYFK